MIKKLSVKNFKSIKELEIDCRRINLFIGEPNTGKSNILEVLGLLSWCGHGRNVPLREYVRFQYIQNLFYDNSTDELIRMVVMEKLVNQKEHKLPISVETGEVRLVMQIALRGERFNFDASLSNSRSWSISLDRLGESPGREGTPGYGLEFIKFYRFDGQSNLQGKESAFLMPPHGSNMFTVVIGSKKLRTIAARFFKDYGFELVLRPYEGILEFQKQIEEEDNISLVFGFPYILASDTLQRMIFYTVAIESNENSTLVFEEPEAHAFPSETYQLGEKIASDGKNQYFIATHNPYLFLSILERAPKDDVNVFITYFEDYQTKVKCLNDEERSKIMAYDPFANLDYFIGTLDSFVEEEEQ